MLRLGRPVGVYPRLEARLAALHLGGAAAAEEEPAVADTGCHECGGKKAEGWDHEDDCTSSEGEPEHDTSSSDDDCGCDQ